MRTRLFLNPSNNTLVGNYPADAEHIHIALDSASAAFTVLLPDVSLPEHKEFMFYNVPSSGSGFDVTIQAVSGQVINISDSTHVLAPGDTVTFVADLRNRWLITDINKYTDRLISPDGSINPVIAADNAGNVNIANGTAYNYGGLPIAQGNSVVNSFFFGNSGNVSVTGAYNYGNGFFSLHSVTTGQSNVGVGVTSLYYNATGNYNIGIGHNSLQQNVDGNYNIAVGANSGMFVASGGTYNTKSTSGIFIGSAQPKVNNGIHETIIGHGLNGNGSHTTTIGNSGNTDMYLAGIIRGNSGRIVKTTRITSASSPYTVLSTDHKIFANTDGGAITILLPAGVLGTEYTIKNTGSSGNNVTLTPNGAEKLFGTAASETVYDGEVLDCQYETLEGWF